MEIVDHGLSWLWRTVVMIGLIGGVLVPPMLLRLINQLKGDPSMLGWRIALVGLYFIVFGVVILAAASVTRHYTGEYQLKRLQRRDWGLIFGGYLVIIILESGFEVVNRLFYHQTQTANNAAIENLMGGSQLALWMMGLSAIFITPVVEELVFRGALTNLFFKRTVFKILLSGLVFGSLHSSSTLPSFLIYVVMGLILATVYRCSGKIKASIVLHFVINAAAISLMILQLT
ncbi:CPBP family intramembrane metalloprotease [Lactiplantibacillus garii]|uniref:CPBP family intramembrane metalloprotease n=1 Tax=Lactiplantibacillus garii TaxID=2306423 RepID=A0A3R8J583_9LACO|nr:type II CAAX endopeptidase family protein [Lactiplantibacillus garii]RRK09376.1 CPBP family intramembrane metalloprotease [Lactiplantibacillus garii]